MHTWNFMQGFLDWDLDLCYAVVDVLVIITYKTISGTLWRII